MGLGFLKSGWMLTHRNHQSRELFDPWEYWGRETPLVARIELRGCVPERDDRHDRTVGDIYDDGMLINLALVEAGCIPP